MKGKWGGGGVNSIPAGQEGETLALWPEVKLFQSCHYTEQNPYYSVPLSHLSLIVYNQ